MSTPRNPSKMPSRTYAVKAAQSPLETLTKAQEIISLTPSILLHEAISMAETLHMQANVPRANPHESTTIQGSKESSCIISLPKLLHQGLVQSIQDMLKADSQLSQLPQHLVAVSNDC
ncbi:hypothetical protein AX15_007470 [Amanita polypyramis BW_CC]|nr:hypothetical protein AX15_007470 [Amanita polypyramis BW_CC]